MRFAGTIFAALTIAACSSPTAPEDHRTLYEKLEGYYNYKAQITADIPVSQNWVIRAGCTQDFLMTVKPIEYPSYYTTHIGLQECPSISQISLVISISSARFVLDRLFLFFPTDAGFSTIESESDPITNVNLLSGIITYVPLEQLSGTWTMARLVPAAAAELLQRMEKIRASYTLVKTTLRVDGQGNTFYSALYTK